MYPFYTFSRKNCLFPPRLMPTGPSGTVTFMTCNCEKSLDIFQNIKWFEASLGAWPDGPRRKTRKTFCDKERGKARYIIKYSQAGIFNNKPGLYTHKKEKTIISKKAKNKNNSLFFLY